jgi:hypothetical protein
MSAPQSNEKSINEQSIQTNVPVRCIFKGIMSAPKSNATQSMSNNKNKNNDSDNSRTTYLSCVFSAHILRFVADYEVHTRLK